jgi:glycosyltransferase 2 family protein
MLKSGTETSPKTTVKIPKGMLIFSILVLGALIAFVVINFSEVGKLKKLLIEAQPWWLLLAFCLQVGTYMSAGAIWYIVIRSAHHHIKLSVLARFSIEKLSIDQLVPALGIAGSMVVYRGIKLFGLPNTLAAEALFIDTFSFYIAYAFVSVAALLVLCFYGGITTFILYGMGFFSIILITVPSILFWMLKRKKKSVPKLVSKIKPLKKMQDLVNDVSRERALSPALLIKSTLLHILIFLFDSLTLYAAMHSLGVHAGYHVAFATIVLASVAKTISLMPGGLGGFEAGSVGILTILGVAVGPAAAATLLFRGLTLWLPLIPGLLLARRDVAFKI